MPPCFKGHARVPPRSPPRERSSVRDQPWEYHVILRQTAHSQAWRFSVRPRSSHCGFTLITVYQADDVRMADRLSDGRIRETGRAGSTSWAVTTPSTIRSMYRLVSMHSLICTAQQADALSTGHSKVCDVKLKSCVLITQRLDQYEQSWST